MSLKITCHACSMPFMLKNDDSKIALDLFQKENLKHHNAYCPKCGKSNRVSKIQLQRATPSWRPKSVKKTPKK
jgi:hypothetical protein